MYRRLGENPASPQWWTLAETAAAINWAQRLFVLLTLCLEDQRALDLTPGTNYYHMLQEPQFADWFAPLRVRLSNTTWSGNNAEFNGPEPGAPLFNDRPQSNPLPYANSPKLRPSRLADFYALSDTWATDVGPPTRYAHLKADLLVLNKSLPVNTTASLLVTFAMIPPKLIDPNDAPQIPEPDHPALVDLATVFCRLKDGGQELAKANALVASFLDCARRRAALVRARSLAQQYDTVPMEIERYDLSRLVKRRADLPPARTKEPAGS